MPTITEFTNGTSLPVDACFSFMFVATGIVHQDFKNTFSPGKTVDLLQKVLAIGTGVPQVRVGFPHDVWLVAAMKRDANLSIVQENVLSAKDRLVLIEKNLGFNISDIAKILGVERKTLYLWKADSEVKPQTRTEERLRKVESIAADWAKLSDKPLVWARGERPLLLGGISVFEALMQPELDERLLRSSLCQLAPRINELAKAERRAQNNAIKKAVLEVRLPSPEEMSAKIKARAAQFQSNAPLEGSST